MKKLFLVQAALLGLLWGSPVGAETEKVIDWKVFYIQAIYNKPGTGEGYADKLFRFFRERLPQFRHTKEDMPIRRIFHDMAHSSQDTICCPIKTPLAPDLMARVVPSNSVLMLAPPGIVVRKADMSQLFANRTQLSVAGLIEEEGFRTSWVRGATYHPAIREVVERNSDRPNVSMQATVIGEFQEMLLRGHIDFYVSHALDFKWHADKNSAVRNELAFLPVLEAPTPVSTLAFCSNTLQGREVIGRINQLIETPEFKAYREQLIDEFFPEDLAEDYIRLHQQPLPVFSWPSPR